MVRVFEKDLKRIIKELNSKDISIRLIGNINTCIYMKNVIASYSTNSGRIMLEDVQSNNSICFKTEYMYNIFQTDNNKLFEIRFDNFINVRIKCK